MNYRVHQSIITIGNFAYDLPATTCEHIIAGNLWLKRRKLSLATQCYEQSVSFGVAHHCLALVCIIEGDHDSALKYYLSAIENGSIGAACCLGLYYERTSDYDNMMKYYLLGIERDDPNAAYHLALYYQKQGDSNGMMRYHLLAIDRQCSKSMVSLARYYHENQDFTLMLKYHLLAIENNNTEAMYDLAQYYQQVKQYECALKYYSLAVDNDSQHSHLNINLNICARQINDATSLIAYRKYFDISNVKRLNNAYTKNIMGNKSNIADNKSNIADNKSNIVGDKSKCGICFDEQTLIKLICKHELCFQCFSKVNNSNCECPYCRRTMELDDATFNDKN